MREREKPACDVGEKQSAVSSKVKADNQPLTLVGGRGGSLMTWIHDDLDEGAAGKGWEEGYQ